MQLRPTDSVAELRHRAALYQQGLMPQLQQQAQMPVLMQPMVQMQMPMMAVPVGGGSTTAASHASMYAGALPYSAAQAQQAALYHAFLQQQSSLQGQLRPHAPFPGGGYHSDSGCSTCSGRHGHYSRSPSRSRSRSRSRSHSRGRGHHSHRSYHSDEHADCVSCTSSCSCTSGCDSEGEHENGHGRNEGTQARRGRRSSGRRASNASVAAAAGPGAAPSPAASITASARRRSKGEQSIGQQQNQSSKSNRKGGASGSDAEMKGAFAAEEDEGIDTTQLNTTERAIDATRIASPSPARAAAAAAARSVGGASEPGSLPSLHVAFGTPSRRRDLSDSVQTAQRERVYESALESITRAEQGFHSYVLSSAQAAEMRSSSGTDGANASAGLASQSQPVPPAGALLRKLLRFEPRGLRRPGDARGPQVSGATSMLGSGNLVYYELVAGPAAAQRFKLSQEEEDLVRRMDSWEHRADVGEPVGLGESPQGLPLDAEDNPASAPIFSAERYASMLAQRRGVALTLDRKAGVIPLRRIRELRAGALPGATRLVSAVNAHLADLNIDEREMVRPEWCVSLLLDRGMVGQARPADGGGEASGGPSVGANSAGTSYHHDSHALKHEACVASFAPELCPRVSTSFGRASHTASAKLRREVARNQRKNLGTTAGTGVGALQWGSDSDDAMGDGGGGSIGATRSSLGRHQSRAHSRPRPRSRSQSQSHGPAGASWVVVCTSSAEEAHTLINALMFLKLLAGQTVSSKDALAQGQAHAQEKEVVHLLPGASPLRKRSKQGEAGAEAGAEAIPPERLTDVLLSAAQHAAQADAQLQAQRQASARSGQRRALLKRKSVPTPSVRTEFAMPSLPTRPSLRASLAASLTPARAAAKAAAASARGTKESKESEASVASQWAAAKVASQTPTPAKPAHKIARDAVRDRDDQEEEDYENDFNELGASARVSYAQRSSSTPVKGAGAGVGASASARVSGGLTLSQLGNGGGAHAAHDASLSVHESEPRAAVATWLQKKEAESERSRRRAEAAAAKAAEARAAKQRESAEALERWQKKQAELAAEKHALLAKQRADAAAEKAEKEAAHAARKAAAKKAYAAFLSRANARAESLARSQRLSLAEAARARRERKRAAQQRFQQWVQQKSDWFVGRVQNIKDRQMERKRMGDGEMNEDDPEEEAALDWQWLEREVESELQAASDAHRAKRNPPAPVASPKLGAAAVTSQSGVPSSPGPAASAAAAAAASSSRGGVDAASDQDLLYGVLDDVDMELWTKLMRGIESTRDELDALRAAQHSAFASEQVGGSAAGRVLLEADRERGGPGPVRVPFPTPLRSLHDREPYTSAAQRAMDDPSEGRGAAAYASGAPVIAVSLHASPYERPEFSPTTAELYAYAQAPPATAAGSAPTPLFHRRPSPFAVDDAVLARESQIRPAEHSGTYTALVDYEERMQMQQQQQQGASFGPDAPLSRSASRARILASPTRAAAAIGPHSSPQLSPLPRGAVRPYEAWLRAEMQQAATPSAAPAPISPGRFGSASASASRRVVADVNLLHSGRREL